MQSKYQILIIIIAFDQSGEILNFKNSKLKPQISDGSGPKKTGPGRALDPGLRAGPGPG